MSNTRLTKADLHQFIGSECVYRHALVRDVVYTEGAQYLAQRAGAYWLLDEIALAQRGDRRIAAEEFQTWRLSVAADRSAQLTCEDGNGRIVFRKKIEWTDFPLDDIVLYFTNRTILLPSEN